MSADVPMIPMGLSIKERKAQVTRQLRERLFTQFCSGIEGVYAAVVAHIKDNMDSTDIEDMERMVNPDNEEFLHEMARAAVKAFNKPKEESDDDSEGKGDGAQGEGDDVLPGTVATGSRPPGEGEGAQAGGNYVPPGTVATGSGPQAPPPQLSAREQAWREHSDRQEVHARQYGRRPTEPAGSSQAPPPPEPVHDEVAADVEMAEPVATIPNPWAGMVEEQQAPKTPEVNEITTALQQGSPETPEDNDDTTALQQEDADEGPPVPPGTPRGEHPGGWMPSFMAPPPPPRDPPSSTSDKVYPQLPSSQSQSQINSDLLARADKAAMASQGVETPGLQPLLMRISCSRLRPHHRRRRLWRCQRPHRHLRSQWCCGTSNRGKALKGKTWSGSVHVGESGQLQDRRTTETCRSLLSSPTLVAICSCR